MNGIFFYKNLIPRRDRGLRDLVGPVGALFGDLRKRREKTSQNRQAQGSRLYHVAGGDEELPGQDARLVYTKSFPPI